MRCCVQTARERHGASGLATVILSTALTLLTQKWGEPPTAATRNQRVACRVKASLYD